MFNIYWFRKFTSNLFIETFKENDTIHCTQIAPDIKYHFTRAACAIFSDICERIAF